jgi:transcriptional regulator with XRE-family HTH domain
MKFARDSRLQALIHRVKDATSKRGERVNLAGHLGVSKQHLNDWLSGRMAPRAEITLRLLEWVTAAKSNKQNARRGGRSIAPGQTRSTKSTYEKRKSGPRKL